MKVLIPIAYYLPGYKAGGPIRSLSNLIERLGDDIDFHVLTRNKDMGSTHHYENIKSNTWHTVGKARVKYLSDSQVTPWNIVKGMREVAPDVLYVNSFFEPSFGIVPLLSSRLGILKTPATVISPRGIFSHEALSIKSWKKNPFLTIAKTLGLAKNAIWHATCEKEKNDIQRIIGENQKIVELSNLLPRVKTVSSTWPTKKPGQLKLIFLARIARIKNLHYAIEVLSRLKCHTTLDIFGPNEDQTYWQRCQQAIQALPENVSVHYCGGVSPEKIDSTLAQYDALFLPTQSENFGFSIIESLTAGCPVVISDATPWRKLQAKNVGWDISLRNPEGFKQALSTLAAMDHSEHTSMRKAAIKMAREFASQEDEVQNYRNLFESAATGTAVNMKSMTSRAA